MSWDENLSDTCSRVIDCQGGFIYHSWTRKYMHVMAFLSFRIIVYVRYILITN